eukprot:COSAG05_NODE_623_length_8291_cov_4.353394_5_plen_127_part_00
MPRQRRCWIACTASRCAIAPRKKERENLRSFVRFSRQSFVVGWIDQLKASSSPSPVGRNYVHYDTDTRLGALLGTGRVSTVNRARLSTHPLPNSTLLSNKNLVSARSIACCTHAWCDGIACVGAEP